MTASEYINQIIAEKGNPHGRAVLLATKATAVAGIIGTTDMKESDRASVGHAFAEFAAHVLCEIVEAHDLSHDEVSADADRFTALAKAEVVALRTLSRDVIARAAARG